MDNGSDERCEIAIDAELARRLIAAQFRHWAELSIEAVPDDGWDNRTFRLGEHMCIRLPSARRYVPQVEKEHFWLPKLAPFLPLPIPEPLAMGNPGCGYPWRWSIYRWRDGETLKRERITDLRSVAVSLAEFLKALETIGAEGAPLAGPHNFYRGGALSVYDGETRQAIDTLDGRIDARKVSKVWDDALSNAWKRAPVWVHGDVSPGNLLVKNGKLTAVIDFGTCAVGDPACDLAIAWTFFQGESRQAFKDVFDFDDGTWARARGWTLWKTLITYAEQSETDSVLVENSKRILVDLIGD